MGIDICISFSSDGQVNFNKNDNTKRAKRNKGESLIDFPNDYCVIDIETTGLDAYYDNIIEISAIKVRDGLIADTFTSLIKPSSYYFFDQEDEENEENIDYLIKDGEKFYYVDTFITELTGITNHMLENAPLFEAIQNDFIKFISSDILIGHNINFDINFLYDNLIKHEICLNNNFVDTLRLSRRLLPELPNHKLKTVAEHFQMNTSNMHRSEQDCLITKQCFHFLREIAVEHYGSCEKFYESTKNNCSKSESDLIRHITTSKIEFNEAHLFYKKEFVFTGKLEKMLRKEAMQIVVDLGGTCNSSVTKNANFLVLGNNDYCSTIKDGKSVKQKKAEQLKLKGYDIEVLSENVFYDLLEE